VSRVGGFLWLLAPDQAGIPASGEPSNDLFLGIVYGTVAIFYVANASLAHRRLATIYVLLCGLHVLAGTVSLCGLLAATEGLIPSLPRFDLFDATFLSMSILLGAYMLFHRRANR
jgi:hypothetical protein